MALVPVPPLNEEAEIISIEDHVDAQQRRKTIIMDCVDPDTGQPFEQSSAYCTATKDYLKDMDEDESNKHQANLRALGKKAHPASGNLPAGETLRKLHLV